MIHFEKKVCRKGFSLLEVLLSLAILGVVLTGSISLVDFFYTFIRNQKISTDRTEISKAVEMALRLNCPCNFSAGTISYNGSGSMPFQEVKYFNGPSCGNVASVPVEVNKKIANLNSGIIVSSMQINQIIALGPNTYRGNLRIDFKAGNNVPSPYQTFSLPFSFVTNGAGILQSCAYSNDSSGGNGAYVQGGHYGYGESCFGECDRKCENKVPPVINGSAYPYYCSCEPGYTPAITATRGGRICKPGENNCNELVYYTCIKQ